MTTTITPTDPESTSHTLISSDTTNANTTPAMEVSSKFTDVVTSPKDVRSTENEGLNVTVPRKIFEPLKPYVKKEHKEVMYYDTRPTAVGIGVSAIICLIAVPLAILCLDLSTLAKHFCMMKRNCIHCWKRHKRRQKPRFTSTEELITPSTSAEDDIVHHPCPAPVGQPLIIDRQPRESVSAPTGGIPPPPQYHLPMKNEIHKRITPTLGQTSHFQIPSFNTLHNREGPKTLPLPEEVHHGRRQYQNKYVKVHAVQSMTFLLDNHTRIAPNNVAETTFTHAPNQFKDKGMFQARHENEQPGAETNQGFISDKKDKLGSGGGAQENGPSMPQHHQGVVVKEEAGDTYLTNVDV